MIDPASGWARLSPLMVLVHPVRLLVRLLPAVLLVLIGTPGPPLLQTGFVAVLLAVVGFWTWLTTTYRVTADQVQIRRGLVSRNVLSVRRDRIRSVDTSAGPLQRALGLVTLSLGTGVTVTQRPGGDRDGLQLDGLSVADAAGLRLGLLGPLPSVGPAGADPADDGSGAPAPVTDVEVVRLSWRSARWAPLTTAGVVALGVAVAGVMQLASEVLGRTGPDDLGSLDDATSSVRGLPAAVLVAVGAVLLLTVYLGAAVATYLLAYWNFRLTRHAQTLHLSRGLLTSRATTLELARLRGVELSEGLLLRVVGGAQLSAVTTGLAGNSDSHTLLPPESVSMAVRVGAGVLGTSEPLVGPLVGHGPAAVRRRWVRACSAAVLLAVALVVGGVPAGWPARVTVPLGMLIVAASVPLARDRGRSLGHRIGSGWLVGRSGTFVRRRWVLAQPGVIGWVWRETWFQRRAGLVSLTATTAAGRQHYAVVDVPVEESVRLAREVLPVTLAAFVETRA